MVQGKQFQDHSSGFTAIFSRNCASTPGECDLVPELRPYHYGRHVEYKNREGALLRGTAEPPRRSCLQGSRLTRTPPT